MRRGGRSRERARPPRLRKTPSSPLYVRHCIVRKRRNCGTSLNVSLSDTAYLTTGPVSAYYMTLEYLEKKHSYDPLEANFRNVTSVGIIGLGYVGLPLSILAAGHGKNSLRRAIAESTAVRLRSSAPTSSACARTSWTYHSKQCAL